MTPNTLKNTYFILRHGQSEANVAGLVVSSPENGINTYGLTQTGKQQVTDSVSAYPGLDRNTRIFSSDFKRTRETAEIAANILGVREGVTFTPNLRERYFGDFELGPDTIYNGVWEKDAADAHPENHVETPAAVLKRVLTCIADIEATHTHETILLVAHGDTLQITLTWFSRIPAHRHREVSHMDTAELRRVPSP